MHHHFSKINFSFFFSLQLQNAVNRQKNLFDNVNFDWNLTHDDGSTDFSDDETIIDDRVCLKYFPLQQWFNLSCLVPC